MRPIISTRASKQNLGVFASIIKAIALFYRHEVVGRDFHPFSGIRQGSLEVSQMCTCFLLSPLLSDGESFTTAAVTFQHRWWAQPRAPSTCYCNLRATIKPLVTYDLWLSVCVQNAVWKKGFKIIVNRLGNEISCWACFCFVLFKCVSLF